MATAGRRANYRYNDRGQTYVYGNTVRKADVAPRREVEPRQPKKVSRQVQKNRSKAMHMNAGYVVFLAVAAIVLLIACVHYLQLQSTVTSRSQNIAALQKELANVKEENTTEYNNLFDSLNMEEIRDQAMKELNMKDAAADQIITYKNPVNNYVKQYESIPKNGVLARSTKAK